MCGNNFPQFLRPYGIQSGSLLFFLTDYLLKKTLICSRLTMNSFNIQMIGFGVTWFLSGATQMLDCRSLENENIGFYHNNRVKVVMLVLLPNTQFSNTN